MSTRKKTQFYWNPTHKKNTTKSKICIFSLNIFVSRSNLNSKRSNPFFSIIFNGKSKQLASKPAPEILYSTKIEKSPILDTNWPWLVCQTKCLSVFDLWNCTENLPKRLWWVYRKFITTKSLFQSNKNNCNRLQTSTDKDSNAKTAYIR